MENQYKVIDSFDLVVAVLDHLETVEWFSFDIEATGLDVYGCQVLGIGISWAGHTAVYIPWYIRDIDLWVGDLSYKWNEEQRDFIVSRLKSLFYDDQIVKVAHDITFDSLWLDVHMGISCEDVKSVFCTKLYTFVKNPKTGGKSQAELALRYLVDTKYSDLKGLKNIWKGVKIDSEGRKDLSACYKTERIGEYCCKDADAAGRLYIEYMEDIKDKPFEKLFGSKLMPTALFVIRMRKQGFLIDIDYLDEKREELSDKRRQLLKDIQSETNISFNPLSDKCLKALFFEKMNLPPRGDGNFDDSVLTYYRDRLGVAFANSILEYRKLNKLVSTYFDGMRSRLI